MNKLIGGGVSWCYRTVVRVDRCILIIHVQVFRSCSAPETLYWLIAIEML
jgi:hypothetical protein